MKSMKKLYTRAELKKFWRNYCSFGELKYLNNLLNSLFNNQKLYKKSYN